ncbi:unknown [Prevotella sp. CAG:592]|nr:unknown [Prevotella sp. CAG:592]
MLAFLILSFIATISFKVFIAIISFHLQHKCL